MRRLLAIVLTFCLTLGLTAQAEELGLDLLLSSDCHDAGKLDYGFADLIKSI